MGVVVLCDLFLLKLPGEIPPHLITLFSAKGHFIFSKSITLASLLYLLLPMRYQFRLRQEKGTLVVVAMRDVETEQVVLLN